MYSLTFDAFAKLAAPGSLVPLYREILADIHTPVTALMNLRAKSYAYLLESMEGGEKWGRYTFLGCDPRTIFRVVGSRVEIEENGKKTSCAHQGDPMKYLKNLVGKYHPVPTDSLPRFYGGALGYLGYDMVRYFEKLPEVITGDSERVDAVFIITDTVVIFDHIRHTIKAVASIRVDEGSDLRSLYDEGLRKIEETIDSVTSKDGEEPVRRSSGGDFSLQPERAPEAFKDMVRKAKEYIVNGDVIQVVLSQRFRRKSDMNPVDLYRALRFINPSPYLFYLKLGDITLIGSSPEVMVRMEEGIAELRPIAGTRRRGKNEQEDRMLADELLGDAKEKAEHIMLVDLGRNDLGRVARTGSVQVTRLMMVERYSHVMHLVSNVQAQLAPGKDAFDVLRATFPAGTLTGAPKVRAMEIIEELEESRRGPYGGAVGYIGYTGNMDLCITIRTITVEEGTLFIQTGAGIVADSDPDLEYEETMHKAKAMMEAIHLAANNFLLTR